MKTKLIEGRGDNGRLLPQYLKALREAKGLTQKEAAALVHTGVRNWRKWEQPRETKSSRPIPEAEYELFCLKVDLKYPVTFRVAAAEEAA